jgi:hypothetical protein
MGGFGRLPMIIGGVMLAIGAFWTWLAVHDHNLKNEVIAEFNLAQERLLAEKKAEFDRQLKQLENTSDDLRKIIETKDAELGNIISEIERGITSKDGKNPAAPYLKEVVGKMQKSFGDKK